MGSDPTYFERAGWMGSDPTYFECVSFRDSLLCESGKRGASDQHVVEAAECLHVVAAVAARLDRGEHRGKVDRAFAGAQVLLVRAPAVGEAHLAAAAHVEPGDEGLDAVGLDVRVVHGEAPAERGRVEALE